MFLAKTDKWYMERTIPLIAGIFTLGSLTLGILVSPYWFILTGLVGLNQMILSSMVTQSLYFSLKEIIIFL